MAEIVIPPDNRFMPNPTTGNKAQNVSISEVKRPFIYSVDWPTDGQWHAVEEQFAQATGITTYRVKWTAGDLIGNQSIDFITNDNYHYTFVDTEESEYEVDVQSEDTIQHVSRVSGQAANIKQVSGTPVVD